MGGPVGLRVLGAGGAAGAFMGGLLCHPTGGTGMWPAISHVLLPLPLLLLLCPRWCWHVVSHVLATAATAVAAFQVLAELAVASAQLEEGAANNLEDEVWQPLDDYTRGVQERVSKGAGRATRGVLKAPGAAGRGRGGGGAGRGGGGARKKKLTFARGVGGGKEQEGAEELQLAGAAFVHVVYL